MSSRTCRIDIRIEGRPSTYLGGHQVAGHADWHGLLIIPENACSLPSTTACVDGGADVDSPFALFMIHLIHHLNTTHAITSRAPAGQADIPARVMAVAAVIDALTFHGFTGRTGAIAAGTLQVLRDPHPDTPTDHQICIAINHLDPPILAIDGDAPRLVRQSRIHHKSSLDAFSLPPDRSPGAPAEAPETVIAHAAAEVGLYRLRCLAAFAHGMRAADGTVAAPTFSPTSLVLFSYLVDLLDGNAVDPKPHAPIPLDHIDQGVRICDWTRAATYLAQARLLRGTRAWTPTAYSVSADADAALCHAAPPDPSGLAHCSGPGPSAPGSDPDPVRTGLAAAQLMRTLHAAPSKYTLDIALLTVRRCMVRDQPAKPLSLGGTPLRLGGHERLAVQASVSRFFANLVAMPGGAGADALARSGMDVRRVIWELTSAPPPGAEQDCRPKCSASSGDQEYSVLG